jgi:pheromone shutdown protein TraB
MPSVEVNGSRVHVLGVVKGLVSEEEKVESAIANLSPDVIGLSVSKEQLAALRSPDAWAEYELSPLESAYKTLMQEFGEVRLPSPAFVKALEIAESSKVPVIPIDMNDNDYTEVYCQKVGAMDLVREGAFSKSVKRRKFDGASPESLAIDWDRRVNKAKGFRKLEAERERHMARALVKLCSRYRNVLALVDCERADGVIGQLDRS